ncbi:MAG: hypothetical protein IT359_15960 [Gemmatimonadaceae bacterium]|nr:hypothetical protein [Gemmatimonadaceae bacterium]
MCCGRNRAAARAAANVNVNANVSANANAGSPPAPRASAGAPRADATTPIVFEFVGEGAHAVRGPVSGASYRFSRRGDRIRVDPRDRPGLLAHASLRWIR